MPSKPATNELGNKVVEFAKSQIGKQVGKGQCSHLVEAALAQAGAKATTDFGVGGSNKDYVWGTPVPNYDDVQPGDIIQFRNVKIMGQLVVKGKKLNVTMTIPHHSSIVYANLGKGRLKLLEQNVGGVKVVQETEMNFATKQSGTVWFYRPVKK